MTLATQCPHCHTTFRVADNQLAALNGLVRCGVCTRIFNANEFLAPNQDTRSPDQIFEDELTAAQHTPAEPVLADDTANADDATPDWQAEYAPETPQTTSPSELHTTAAEPIVESDEFDTQTLADELPEDDLVALDEPQSQAVLQGEPKFIKANRRKQQSQKILRIVMIITAVPLLLAALGQAAYMWRHQLAAALPVTKPLLVAACAKLHCRVGVATDIEQVSLESSELQTLPDSPGIFMLSLLLRNNSNLAQAWPHIELTVNDGTEKPLVRRVLLPKDYLPAATPIENGFDQHNEQAVSVRFTLTEATASGYHVYLFYP
jgi:predicted Zn finger-like uncharacterized protein